MIYSPNFGELLFNLFYTVVFIIFSGINVYFYEKIRSKPSTAISNNEAESMFVTSIVLVCISIIVLVYFLYRLFKHTSSKVEIVRNNGILVKTSPTSRQLNNQSEDTLKNFDLSDISNIGKKPSFDFFNNELGKQRTNINSDIEQPPINEPIPPSRIQLLGGSY